MTITRALPASIVLLLAVHAFCAPVHGQAPHSSTPRAIEAPIRVTTVAKGLEHPWGLAILPDGRMLVTERPGRLRVVHPNGSVSGALIGVPKVYAHGQGGLLDVALSPGFHRDRMVYLSY